MDSIRMQKQRMLAGELYRADDPELIVSGPGRERVLAQLNAAAAEDARQHLLQELFGSVGEGAILRPSFRCDYGYNIALGARGFVNFDCVLLDCNRVDIGGTC